MGHVAGEPDLLRPPGPVRLEQALIGRDRPGRRRVQVLARHEGDRRRVLEPRPQQVGLAVVVAEDDRLAGRDTFLDEGHDEGLELIVGIVEARLVEVPDVAPGGTGPHRRAPRWPGPRCESAGPVTRTVAAIPEQNSRELVVITSSPARPVVGTPAGPRTVMRGSSRWLMSLSFPRGPGACPPPRDSLPDRPAGLTWPSRPGKMWITRSPSPRPARPSRLGEGGPSPPGEGEPFAAFVEAAAPWCWRAFWEEGQQRDRCNLGHRAFKHRPEVLPLPARPP